MIYSGQGIAVGGNTALAQGCDDLAIDGFLVTGVMLAYQFSLVNYSIDAGTQAPVAAASYTNSATDLA